jgi:hypothetical protein
MSLDFLARLLQSSQGGVERPILLQQLDRCGGRLQQPGFRLTGLRRGLGAGLGHFLLAALALFCLSYRFGLASVMFLEGRD